MIIRCHYAEHKSRWVGSYTPNQRRSSTMASRHFDDPDGLVKQGHFFGSFCISLTQGRHAIASAEDYEAIIKYEWRYNNNGYAIQAKSPNPIGMHHVVLPRMNGMVHDHINHNKLDNRRENLRICTHAENARYRRKRRGSVSKYKGVCFNKPQGKWQAKIWVDGKNKHLGSFTCEIAAARAYDAAARHYYGEFAVLNNIPISPNEPPEMQH